MIGQVYGVPPEPPVAENTTVLPAGVVTFGVEYRRLDPERLREIYGGNPEHMAEVERLSPEGGFKDQGVSIHVTGTDDGHEYLRFDVFDDEPHYHYIHPAPAGGEVLNNVIDFDATALGDMFPWAMDRLRYRLPEMLSEAGGAHLVPRLDQGLVAKVVDEVADLAAAARQLRAD